MQSRLCASKKQPYAGCFLGSYVFIGIRAIIGFGVVQLRDDLLNLFLGALLRMLSRFAEVYTSAARYVKDYPPSQHQKL